MKLLFRARLVECARSLRTRSNRRMYVQEERYKENTKIQKRRLAVPPPSSGEKQALVEKGRFHIMTLLAAMCWQFGYLIAGRILRFNLINYRKCKMRAVGISRA